MSWGTLAELAAVASAGMAVALVMALLCRSVPLRLGFLLLGSAIAVLSPAIMVARHQIDAGVLPNPQQPRYEHPQTKAAVSDPLPAQTAQTLGRQSLPDPGQSPSVAEPFSMPVWPVLVAWGIGSVAMLIGLGFDLRRSVRLGASSTTPACEDIKQSAVRIAQGMNLRHAPEVWISPEVAAPCVAPFGRGAVYLPPGAEVLDHIESVLVHEIAHVRHRHGLAGLLQGFALAAFWWNPLAWLLDRWGQQSMEELCDLEVVKFDPALGRSLATQLVHFAELASRLRPSRTTATMISSKSGLEQRIRRLISLGGTPMTQINTRGLLALAATGSAAVVLGVILQTSTAGTPSKGLMPLIEGAQWEYVRTDYEGKQSMVDMIAWSQKDVKGIPVMEVKLSSGGYEYWSARPDGIYVHENAYLGRLRGVNPEGRVTCLVQTPVRSGATWSWTYHAAYQTSGAAEPLSPEVTLVRASATIESVNEHVTVPAGRFKAVKVVHQESGRLWGNHTKTFWFAEGVGMVKRIDSDSNQPREIVWELKSFTPGAQSRPTQELAEELMRKAFPGEAITLQEISNHSIATAMKSRFFLTQKPGRFGMIRVFDNSAKFFDPLLPKDWNTVIAQERYDERASLNQIVQVAPILVAIQRGLPVTARTAVQKSTMTSGESGLIRASGTLIGEDWNVEVTLNFRNNIVVQARVSPER